MMKIFKKNNGSVTLEAAISLVITVSAILTISLFARIVYVHGVVQHALIQTANEMATYSYILSKTGILEINDAIVQKGNAASANVSEDIDKVTKTIDDTKDVYGRITGGKFSGLDDAIGQVRDDVDDVKTIKPMETIKNFGTALISEGVGVARTTGINAFVTRPLMKTYMPKDLNAFFKMGMFVKKEHLLDKNFPIDLSLSKYYENDDGDEIYIVAVYNIKMVTPIPIVDNITVVQSAKARAWRCDWDTSVKQEEEDVWANGNFPRAEKISSMNPNINLHPRYPKLRGYNESSKTAYTYATINLRNESYKGKPSAIKGTLNRKIHDVMNFKDTTFNGTSIEVQNINKVVYYIYIPKTDVDPADKQTVEQYKNDNRTIELSDDRTVPLEIIIVEV